jgi:hypothetical protein
MGEQRYHRTAEPDEEDMPRQLRWSMVFIDRVGFPIFAFLLMTYMCFFTLHKVSESVTKNTEVLSALKEEIERGR